MSKLKSIDMKLNSYYKVGDFLEDYIKQNHKDIVQQVKEINSKIEKTNKQKDREDNYGKLKLGSVPKKLLSTYKDFEYLEKDKKNYGVLVGMLALAPYDSANISNGKDIINTCPKATKGCSDACLGVSDSKVRNIARIKRTILLYNHRKYFYDKLFLEIYNHIIEAINSNMIPVIRLNGLSDLLWEKNEYKFKLSEHVKKRILADKDKMLFSYQNLMNKISGNTILSQKIQQLKKTKNGKLSIVNCDAIEDEKKHSFFEYFPSILFYDYTKYKFTRFKNLRNSVIDNYFLTYSRSETSSNHIIKKFLTEGYNVNYVFSSDMMIKIKNKHDQKLPIYLKAEKNKYAVIDGNKYDCRLLDPDNTAFILAQETTARGRSDKTNFVINNLTIHSSGRISVGK